MTALLEADRVTVIFGSGTRQLAAVRDASLQLAPGEILALIGESGSGKTSLARALVRLHPVRTGALRFDGQEYTRANGAALARVRREVQFVFQDPYSSLDPRWSVGRIVAEPLASHRIGSSSQRAERVGALLAAVGLDPAAASRRPAAFSGGQRQRIAIARALALSPRLLIADEPMSALDVSTQRQVADLLRQLRADRGLGVLLIAHDLALAHELADRMAVMYLGSIVEEGPAAALAARPLHPYTAALLAATPDITRRRPRPVLLKGDPPDPYQPPSGCAFHPRCPIARPVCAVEPPPLYDLEPGRRSACHFAGETPSPHVA